jgi:hypothetical protein
MAMKTQDEQTIDTIFPCVHFIPVVHWTCKMDYNLLLEK